MADDERSLLSLPDDLRELAILLHQETKIPLEVFVRIYQRGVNAKIGATGEYPFGKHHPDDQGELAVAMAADHQMRVVRLEFGKPVAWLALPAAHARQLAKILVQKAEELERRGN